MRFKHLVFLLLLPLFSCSTNPYDTSTPENIVLSMGKIGEQPKDHNPLPYFYDKESADAIFAFDQAAEKGLTSFNTFRNAVATKFPEYVKSNQKGKLKVALDGFAGFNVRNFTYSASMIGAQLKERKPSDYEFVSASGPNEEGIVQLKVKVLGKLATIPLKKTVDGYRMFSTEQQLENIKKSVSRIKEFDAVFSRGIELVKSGELTPKNFAEKMALLSEEYFKAVRK